MEVGTWTGDNEIITGGDENRDETDRQHAERPTSEDAEGSRVRAAAPRKRAYTWAWYDEPARWVAEQDVEDEGVLPPVNWVRTDVTWEPDGTCAVAAGAYGATDLYDYHFSGSGWSRVSRDWQHSLQGGTTSVCPGPIHSRGFLHYRNVPFCLGLGALPFVPPDPRGPTNTYYEPTAVEGYKDGTARYYWQATRKAGGCQELLRMAHRQDFTNTGPFGGP